MTLTQAASRPFDVAIVGGGFSGVMVALNIARAATSAVRVVIVERRAEPGRGTAYAAEPRDAILNVPAGAMGAFPDDPGGFARWLGTADPTAFAPRHLYGKYVQDLLVRAQADGHAISLIRAEVAGLRTQRFGRTLIDAAGQTIASATHVVLALGAPAPADLVPALSDAVRGHRAYVGNPWVFLREPVFAVGGDIVVTGSGLTALDVIAAFARSGAPNHLRVVSRGGRFPLAHAEPGAGAPVAAIRAGSTPATIREIVALVRASVRESAAIGVDWRRVMDGLRPEIAALWRGLGERERRRFLRHVRPLFDPHRHRAPGALLAHKDELVHRGQLTLTAARVIDIEAAGAGLAVTVQPRGTSDRVVLPATLIINCGGPANDYARSRDALVRQLLADGEICIDTSGLGLRAQPDGRLIGANGAPSSELFTIGWPMRGTLFETTAVRELREHAVRLGVELARLCDDRVTPVSSTADR